MKIGSNTQVVDVMPACQIPPIGETQNQALRNEWDKYQLTQMVKQH